MACATLKRTLDFDPLHSPGTSPKRRRCSPIITPSTPSSKPSLQQSPFSPVTPRISPGQLAAHISQEWRRIKRRRRLEDSYTSDASQSEEHSHITSQVVHQAAMHASPASFASAAAGLGLSATFPGVGSSAPSTSSASPGLSVGSLSPQTKDQPMFTLKQVILICERMLKEQETRIREEYDRVLTCKLAEQYDAFVKFNQDQIQRRFSASSMSYVS
ncbi:akirin-2-like [Diadema setosum]|uniref:akirin-2-like n=1 Tax=Diadema antillarum TaxID=105358 RepID=UPI003A8430CA